jgi:hypothetical protein
MKIFIALKIYNNSLIQYNKYLFRIFLIIFFFIFKTSEFCIFAQDSSVLKDKIEYKYNALMLDSLTDHLKYVNTEKPGYNLSHISEMKSRNNSLLLTDTLEYKEVYKNSQTFFKSKRNLFAILSLSTVSVISGFLSYNFKQKGNDAYESYQITYDRNDLDKSKKYDIYSVLSLCAMELALTGVAYLLFLDK